jgi:hypothetical protein
MLLVETGEGLSNSECCQSAADFKTWADNRGYDWSAYGDTAEIEAAKRRAVPWQEGQYEGRLTGCRITATQARAFPRSGAVNAYGFAIAANTVPQAWIDAEGEATWRELVTPGSLAPDVQAGSPQIKRFREKTGPLEEETEYAVSGQMQPSFSAIDNALAPLLGASVGSRYSGSVCR